MGYESTGREIAQSLGGHLEPDFRVAEDSGGQRSPGQQHQRKRESWQTLGSGGTGACSGNVELSLHVSDGRVGASDAMGRR